jgi:hypothetical protein
MPHYYRAVEWVETYLGSCVYTNTQYASVFIGLSSIGLWLCAQAPQVCLILTSAAHWCQNCRVR